jgi:two-component system, chemotaxis family, chemotaxis protein CheY
VTEIEKVPITPLRVLVVDDSSLARLYYHNILAKAGFEIDQAINGVEAMEKVLAQAFDLLIVDVNTPRMDGFLSSRPATRRGGGRNGSGFSHFHRGR